MNKNILEKATNAVGLYMQKTFKELVWTVFDLKESDDNLITVKVSTNSADEIFKELEFHYLAAEGQLVPQFESLFISYLLEHLQDDEGCSLNKFIKKIYFAVYDEADREDGMPEYVSISKDMLRSVNGIEELLSLAGSFKGNGCIELRITDTDGEEDTYVYMDKGGYKILTDAV